MKRKFASDWRVLKDWWLDHDRHYAWWRLATYVTVGVMVAGIMMPSLAVLEDYERYRLTASAKQLTGEANAKLSSQLSYDTATRVYSFNKSAVKTSDNPVDQLKSKVGAANKKGDSLYALDVPADLSQGVKYTDINSQLGFSLVPEFKSHEGRVKNGHLVYPIDGGIQGVYTLKNNGLKEDIVVSEAPADTMSFRYRLNLPDSLQMRMIPNGGGAVGIYSADPTLFGDISFGSDTDRAKVEAARKNGAKTFLVFGLPAPVITAPAGKSTGAAKAHFELDATHLTIVAEHMKTTKTTVSIDPSVVVTTTSDFRSRGNNDENIDFDTTDQVTRGKLTGGDVSATWSSGGSVSSSSNSRYTAATVAYNGYIYDAGGNNGSATIDYAPINTNGSLGSWSTTTVMPRANLYPAMVAYNGYMYLYSGVSGTTVFANVDYAIINSNGTLGSWTATTAMNTAACRNGFAVYNGYLYATGGNTGTITSNCANTSTPSNIVQFAPINPNGTVGTWATTTAFTTARMSPTTQAYNGYLYVVGGTVDGTTQTKDSQYAKINSDGTVGTWKTTSFVGLDSNGVYRHGMVENNGYMYVFGGCGGGNCGTVWYSQINADGSLNVWQTGSYSTTQTGWGPGIAAYNGYLYRIGGSNATEQNVEYAPIVAAGAVGKFAADNTFTTTRRGLATVAYGDYLYVLGGDNGGTPVNTVYAAPYTNDGQIGSYASTTAFTTNRTFLSAVAYNGYMYVIGGCSSAFASCTTAANNEATVYMASITASTGALSAWTAQTSFTTARYGLSAVAYNGYLYVMGGLNGSTFQNDIQYHAFGASGAISGAWTTSSKTITAAAYMGAAVNAGYLYLAGGCTAGALTCTSTSNSVYYAPLASSGDLNATLTTNGTSFTNSRGMLGMAILNGNMYVSGGWAGSSTYYSDVQYAPVNTNGSVGSWTSSPATLSTTMGGIGLAASGGALYVTGGYDGTTYYTSTQTAEVNNGGIGLVGGWTTSGTSFTTGRETHSTVAYQGYLYVIGGFDGTNKLTSVSYAPLNGDGTVGSWTVDSHSFTNGRYDLSATAYNGFMYILGGTDGSTYYTDIQYAPIGGSGGLTAAWASAGGALSNGGQGSNVVAYNGYIYSLGGLIGATDYNTVYYALICTGANSGTGGCGATAGTVGTWTSTSSYTQTRSNGKALAYNGYMYIVGGNSTSDYNDVQYATINGNGTLGSWSATTSFHIARSDFTVGVSNGFMYIVGGTDINQTLSYRDVEFAAINSNGTLGNWQGSNVVAAAFVGTYGTIYNGFVYLTGGYDGSTYRATTDFAPLLAIPRVSHYSKYIDLGGAVNVSTLTYNGTVPTGASGVTYQASGSGGTSWSAAATTSSLGASSSCANGAGNTRYLLLRATLDDSMLGGAVFPDSASTYAKITDMTVSFNTVHPASNIRLKTGQTLQNGGISAYDTCTP